MPRNPNKRHCMSPGCRSWAMRGHSLCRAHLNHQLGRPAAGAPRRNANAVKTGRYANPYSKEQLAEIAYQINREPDALSRHVTRALHAIEGRSNNPLKSLYLLVRFLQQLIPYVADNRFATRLDRYLQGFPPSSRPAIQAHIWKHALPFSPEKRLLLLEALMDRVSQKKRSSGKTINGTYDDDR